MYVYQYYILYAEYDTCMMPCSHLSDPTCTFGSYQCSYMHTHVHNIHADNWQLSSICVDCTAINNHVNNIHSLSSGPVGGGGG